MKSQHFLDEKNLVKNGHQGEWKKNKQEEMGLRFGSSAIRSFVVYLNKNTNFTLGTRNFIFIIF